MGNMNKTQRLVGKALFTAIIVVLQIIGTFVRIGTFPISLVQIPIVVGAALYGPAAGAYFGGVFGVVVTLACIFGWDLGGFILWQAGPFLTVLLCLVKGILAGWCAGLVFKALAKRLNFWSVVVSALACAVVNTGIFLLGMNLFFSDILIEWAAGTAVVAYMITGLVGVNFLIEVALSMVLSPAIARIIKIGKTS